MSTPPVCDYEGSDYQTSFWDQGGREYEDAVEAVALKRLMPPKGKHLLELGAGAGRNTPRYKGFEKITLVDYSHSQLMQARQRLGASERYRFVAADIYRLPFSAGIFDAATMIRTLHHLADVPGALAQVQHALSSDAVFILEFANKKNLKAIARFLLGKQPWNPFSHDAVEFVELNFDFHPARVDEWLKQSDFKVERKLTVSHLRAGLFKKLFPLKLLVGMDSLFQLTGDWWQFTPSVFIRASSIAKPVETGQTLFCCPACKMPLPDTPPELVCPSCAQAYPVIDGVYDFRLRIS